MNARTLVNVTLLGLGLLIVVVPARILIRLFETQIIKFVAGNILLKIGAFVAVLVPGLLCAWFILWLLSRTNHRNRIGRKRLKEIENELREGYLSDKSLNPDK
jgi:hypothetical protein